MRLLILKPNPNPLATFKPTPQLQAYSRPTRVTLLLTYFGAPLLRVSTRIYGALKTRLSSFHTFFSNS